MLGKCNPYVFSAVNNKKLNRCPPNATAGSGKSKLNFIHESPRGGMNTSLVEYKSMIAPPVYRRELARERRRQLGGHLRERHEYSGSGDAEGFQPGATGPTSGHSGEPPDLNCDYREPIAGNR
jgi:hypothetical protein